MQPLVAISMDNSSVDVEIKFLTRFKLLVLLARMITKTKTASHHFCCVHGIVV